MALEPTEEFIQQAEALGREFALRAQIEKAKDMLIELREQRDQAKDLRDDALKAAKFYEAKLTKVYDQLILFERRSWWQRLTTKRTFIEELFDALQA
jgi:hypothetical protein